MVLTVVIQLTGGIYAGYVQYLSLLHRSDQYHAHFLVILHTVIVLVAFSCPRYLGQKIHHQVPTTNHRVREDIFKGKLLHPLKLPSTASMTTPSSPSIAKATSSSPLCQQQTTQADDDALFHPCRSPPYLLLSYPTPSFSSCSLPLCADMGKALKYRFSRTREKEVDYT